MAFCSLSMYNEPNAYRFIYHEFAATLRATRSFYYARRGRAVRVRVGRYTRPAPLTLF